MNVDENGSVGNAFVQSMAFFISGKVKMTIRGAGQSLKSTTLTSHITWQVLVLALSYLHLHMIWIIEHCCVEVKACDQNSSKNWCCHHNGWSIVLQADADQMAKCCDPLGSGMSTSMYSSGFCPIASDKIIYNIYDGEPSTWIKLIKLH